MEKTKEATIANVLSALPEHQRNMQINKILHWLMTDQQSCGPPVVYEEAVTVSSNVGRLKYNAAFICMVSDGNVVYSMVDKGTTPTTGEVAVDLVPADGGNSKLTFLAGDSVTSCYVWYITEFVQEIFDNLVVETVDATAASGHASLATQTITITDGAVGIMYVDVDGAPKKSVESADTQAAGEYKLTWDSSGDTTLVGYGTEFSGATAINIAFIKKPSTGPLVTNFVDEETTAVGGDDVVPLAYPIFMLATAGFITTSDKAPAPLLRSGGTLQAGQAHFVATTLQYWSRTPSITFHADLDPTNLVLSYLRGNPSEYALRTPPRLQSRLGL